MEKEIIIVITKVVEEKIEMRIAEEESQKIRKEVLIVKNKEETNQEDLIKRAKEAQRARKEDN